MGSAHRKILTTTCSLENLQTQAVKERPKLGKRALTGVPDEMYVASDSVEFSNEEMAMLKNSFDHIVNKSRDEMAEKILDNIQHEVIGALQRHRENQYLESDNWRDWGLGMILLSGVERLLLRVNSPKQLQTIAKYLLKHHQDMDIDSNMLVASIEAASPVILMTVKNLHETSNEPCHCDLCQLWLRFFCYIIYIFRSAC